MIVDIIGNPVTDVNLFPATKIEEIIQNIKILLSTYVGEVVLDRKLGINQKFLDEPSPIAKAKLSIYIVESIQDCEPRVEGIKVTFVNDQNQAGDGILYPKVQVRIKDEFTKY